MNTPIIEVRNLSKTFVLHQQGGVAIEALSGISFSVDAGECVALHGPSGAGKSTLLRALYGNYLPTGGSIRVRCGGEDVDITSADPRTVIRLRRGCISYVSQFLRVIPRVSTLDLVAEPLLEAGEGQAAARSRAEGLLARLNLPERLWHIAPATFSGGEQQRVNIARGFIRPSPILLLDEPTASLDGANRQVVIDLIREARGPPSWAFSTTTWPAKPWPTAPSPSGARNLFHQEHTAMNETVFTNARLITPDAVVEGTLVVRDGRIVSLDNGASSLAERIDLEGDYLMPGLVELHTDNLEKHFIPRPKVLWPQGVPAFFAHDAQIVASGITTVFDALSVGEYHDKGRIAMLGKAVGALNSCRSTGKLRSEHLLHLRCEVADPRMQDLFFPLSDTPALSLVSLMDHTPGQRQWRDTSSYRTYYSNIASWTDEEFEQVVERLQTARDGCAEDNAASVMAFCRERGLPMASHDDTLVEHVEEALGNGIAISEFPTTMEAARHASENGMLVLMGAPNVVRGGSHSGNISALEIAQAGYLGSLSSDYVPISLLEAAFALSEGGYMSLPAAVGLVTANPAEAVGLTDRGSLEVGRRADLVRVSMVEGQPVVRNVWREGAEVF